MNATRNIETTEKMSAINTYCATYRANMTLEESAEEIRLSSGRNVLDCGEKMS
jgi:hypothetical protein